MLNVRFGRTGPLGGNTGGGGAGTGSWTGSRGMKAKFAILAFTGEGGEVGEVTAGSIFISGGSLGGGWIGLLSGDAVGVGVCGCGSGKEELCDGGEGGGED